MVALCSTTEHRNARNVESLNEAAAYITDEWLKLGVELEIQTHMVDSKAMLCYQIIDVDQKYKLNYESNTFAEIQAI